MIITTLVPWTTDAYGVIHFTLTSNGMNPEQWESHLENRGFCFSDSARSMFRRIDQAPTEGVVYPIAVCPGKIIKPNDRITEKILKVAEAQGQLKPHWEVSCLIRDAFPDEAIKQMGLRVITTMHEPIIDSHDVPNLICAERGGTGGLVSADYGRSGGYWYSNVGFAFVNPAGHQA